MGAVCGNDRVDRNLGALPAARIDAAVQVIEDAAQRIADLIEHDQSNRILITDPLKRHSGDVGSEYLLI